MINESPDLDATTEPNDLPDLAVQPGVVDPAGLDDAAGHANIFDDNGVLNVVDKDVVGDTSALTRSFWKPLRNLQTAIAAVVNDTLGNLPWILTATMTTLIDSNGDDDAAKCASSADADYELRADLEANDLDDRTQG